MKSHELLREVFQTHNPKQIAEGMGLSVSMVYKWAVAPATNRVVQEFAEMLSVIANAAVDNDISRAEAEMIRSRWEDLKSVTEGFVRACEEGNFQTIHEGKA